MRNLAFLVLLISFCINAQIVTVKDSKSNKSLELVSVYSTDLNRALITDAKGRVDISSFKGSKELIFRLVGYEKLIIKYDELSLNKFIISMSEKPISIENVIVTANRWAEDKTEIAHTIEVISPKDVEIMNPQTTADMLTMTGNVFVQKSQLGGGSPMIRGFATNRVLIVVDNVRMNNAIFRSGNIQNIISLDANSLANTQVIFGPGSVMFGSDAIGGVMEFNTLSPHFSYGNDLTITGSAFTRYSSANSEKAGGFNASIGLSNFSFLTSITYSDFGDLKMGNNGSDDYLRKTYQDRINGNDSTVINPDPLIQKLSGYNQINTMQKIRFKLNSDFELNYGFHYSNTSDVPRYDRLIEYRNNNLRSAEWYYGPQKWVMHNFSVLHFADNMFYDLSKSNFAYQLFEESRHDRNFGNNTLNNRYDRVAAYSLNLDFLKELGSNSQLNYGVEGVLNQISSIGFSRNIVTNVEKGISTRYPDGSDWKSFGLYASHKLKLYDRFVINSALRYSFITTTSKYDSTFFKFPFSTSTLSTSALTGSVGLVSHISSDMQLNLSLSTGFRAPNIDDIGKVFDSAPGKVVVPNPSLKPEYITNIEAGFVKVFLNRLKIEASAYYSYLNDAMVRRDFNLNGQDSILYDGTMSKVEAIQNGAFAYIYGVQLGVEYKFLKSFGLVSKFSYQKGKEEDDSGNEVPLRHAPPYYCTVRFTYENEDFNAMLYSDFNGEVSYQNLAPSEREKSAIYAKDSDGNPYSPAWFTLNAKLGYFLFDLIHLNVGVENILDKRYKTYSSGIVAPGRNFILSFRYKY